MSLLGGRSFRSLSGRSEAGCRTAGQPVHWSLHAICIIIPLYNPSSDQAILLIKHFVLNRRFYSPIFVRLFVTTQLSIVPTFFSRSDRERSVFITLKIRSNSFSIVSINFFRVLMPVVGWPLRGLHLRSPLRSACSLVFRRIRDGELDTANSRPIQSSAVRRSPGDSSSERS